VRPVLIVLAGDLDTGLTGADADPSTAEALLAATLDVARQVGGVGRVLLFHPVAAESRLAPKALGFRLWPAEGETPGRRFANAFRQAGDLGYEGAIVIDPLAASLPAERLTEAAAMLDEHQGVLIPDEAGGITALGLQRDEPALVTAEGDVPDAETIRTRARQLLVRVTELDPHPRLDPADIPAFLADRA
jgi:glycosyltransferase A (GT-A) superfamily protein (DUF2064 family)